MKKAVGEDEPPRLSLSGDTAGGRSDVARASPSIAAGRDAGLGPPNASAAAPPWPTWHPLRAANKCIDVGGGSGDSG